LTLTRVTGGAGGNSAAGPVRRDLNLRLLGWRLALALLMASAVTVVYLLGSPGIALPGVLGSLGLLFTSIAVCWAAALAGAPVRLLLACQLSADTICIGLLVHFTGGPFSAFPLVFCLPIMMGAYFLEARWAMAYAGAAAILTGGGHFGLALGWLLTGQDSPLDYLQGWPVVVTAVHVSVFLVTGMISGGLARRLDRRKQDHAIIRRQVQKARWEVRNILDNIRSGLITVDCQGTITRVNPACCATLCRSSKEMLGNDIRQVLDDGMADLAAIIMPVANGGAGVSRGEVRVTRAGQEMPLGLNVNPVSAPDGRCIGAIAIFTDLTREKEMNARIRESDRLAAIGELSASIAHEIRNPLASIRGSVEILAGELELEGYQSQLLALVLKESGRVNTIINDFLAYSRMPAARKSLFNADEFFDQLVLQVEQHVAAKGGRVAVRGSVQPPDLLVVADQGQMTQLALNLAINACEAMDYRGDVRMAMSLVGDGESYEIVVTDDGPGIDPEIRDHLFSPFKTTKEGGTGLGLSTAARIASSHGGTLRAEDAPGGGSIFRVRWPREETPTEDRGEISSESEALTLS